MEQPPPAVRALHGLYEDGGLIAGHARILAAQQLGIAEIPVMVAAGWSEAQKRAYVLADRAVGDRSADPIRQKCTDPHGCSGRRHRREHRGGGCWLRSRAWWG